MNLTDARAALIGFLLVVSASFGAGFMLADHLNSREQVTSAHHDEIRTAPNNVAPEVTPGAKPKQPAPTLARGGKTIGTAELHVTQPPVIVPERRVGDVVCPAHTVTCPPLDLRIDWNRTDDGGDYVAVRGADGTEITGRYIPAATFPAPPDKRLTVVGNPRGDVVATFAKSGHRWSWAASAGYIDQSPWAAAGVGFSWR